MNKRFSSEHTKKALLAILVGMFLVVFVFIIMNIGSVFSAIGTFISILTPFIWGFGIAYLLNGLVNIFEYRVFSFLNKKKPRNSLVNGLSVTLSILFFLGILFGLVSIIIPNVFNSLLMLVQSFPGYLEAFQETLHGLEQSINIELSFIENINISWDTIISQLDDWLREVYPDIANASINLVISVAGGISNSFIALIVAIYIMLARKSFVSSSKKVIFAILPRKQATRTLKELRNSHKIFSKFIRGKLLESLIVWVMTFVIMVIVMPANPYNLLISVLMAIFNIIPFFGPFIGAIPSLLILLVYNPTYALWFLIIVIITQQIDGQIIGPKILGDSTGLMPFWVIFAIIVGGGLFGIIGMILGIPVFAVIYSIITQIINASLKKKGLSTNHEHYENPLESEQYIIKKNTEKED